MIGISGNLVDGKGFVSSATDGPPLVEPELYPKIFKCFQDLHFELNIFPSMSMHLCCLGVEKSMIDQTKILFSMVGKTCKETSGINSCSQCNMQRRQQVFNTVLIDWCLVMLFSGEKISLAMQAGRLIVALQLGFPFFSLQI